MAVFLIGEMKRENAREREFDKEEQARREYRRFCLKAKIAPVRWKQSAFRGGFFSNRNERKCFMIYEARREDLSLLSADFTWLKFYKSLYSRPERRFCCFLINQMRP